jgi:hypothetical protein
MHLPPPLGPLPWIRKTPPNTNVTCKQIRLLSLPEIHKFAVSPSGNSNHDEKSMHLGDRRRSFFACYGRAAEPMLATKLRHLLSQRLPILPFRCLRPV